MSILTKDNNSSFGPQHTQVQSLSRKPLTVAFEEIAAGKVEISDNEVVVVKDTKKNIKKTTVGDLGIDE